MNTNREERKQIDFIQESIANVLHINRDSSFVYYKLLRNPLDTTAYKCKYWGFWYVKNDSLVLKITNVISKVYIIEAIGKPAIKKDTCSQMNGLKFKISGKRLILNKKQKLFLYNN